MIGEDLLFYYSPSCHTHIMHVQSFLFFSSLLVSIRLVRLSQLVLRTGGWGVCFPALCAIVFIFYIVIQNSFFDGMKSRWMKKNSLLANSGDLQ